MLIISKFKDYYDSASNMGVDKSIVYERHTSEIDAVSLKLSDRIPWIMGNGDEFNLIGFAGKTYVCYTWIVKGKGMYDPSKKYFSYGTDILDKFGSNEELSTYDRSINRRQEDLINIQKILDMFHDKDSDLFFEYNVPIFIREIKRSPRYAFERKTLPVTLNPCLKDYEFFKMKDVYTAWQELQWFISGVLHNNKPERPIDDKYKILAAGFDLKTSFRRDKKEK